MKEEKKTSWFKRLFGPKTSCCSLELEEVDPKEDTTSATTINPPTHDTMTTYVYETIPSKPGEETEYFEIKQSMNDTALSAHPETGVPIRRVILGGLGVLKSTAGQSQSNSDSCGPGCCCG